MRINEKHTCEQKTEDYLYRIGMFAQMNHITVKTLRFYEEQGLLLPALINEENGYRYYKMSQMEEVHRILALKEAGFTLEDIGKLRDSADRTGLLLRKKSELLAKIAELTLMVSRLDAYMAEGGTSLSVPVRIKKLPAVICATSQCYIDAYDELFDKMPEMGALMEKSGCVCDIPEYCFTNYLESAEKEGQILIETCEAVTKKGKDTERLKFKEFPETEAACVYHKGSYDNFSQTYGIVLKYIEENDYEICGSIRENYIDGAWNKDYEEEWLSEIQVPVRKKHFSS